MPFKMCMCKIKIIHVRAGMLKEYTVFLFQLCNCKYITSIIPGENCFHFLSNFGRKLPDSFIANTLFFLQLLWSEYENHFQTFAVVVNFGVFQKLKNHSFYQEIQFFHTFNHTANWNFHKKKKHRASKVMCACFFTLNFENPL